MISSTVNCKEIKKKGEREWKRELWIKIKRQNMYQQTIYGPDLEFDSNKLFKKLYTGRTIGGFEYSLDVW